jgi:hypothetical protein
MTSLSDKQLDMLCEMADIHYQWFQKYSPDITYEEVLELNHIKVVSIIDGCFDCTDEMLDIIFDSIIRDYKEMLSDEGLDLDELY